MVNPGSADIAGLNCGTRRRRAEGDFFGPGSGLAGEFPAQNFPKTAGFCRRWIEKAPPIAVVGNRV